MTDDNSPRDADGRTEQDDRSFHDRATEALPSTDDGIRRRTVIAATLGSPAIFGLGFAATDRLALTSSLAPAVSGSASPLERAMAGESVLAQMDSTTVSVGEEPAQDVPTNQYRALQASGEVLDNLEREVGDQVLVTREEDSAVYTITEELDSTALDGEEDGFGEEEEDGFGETGNETEDDGFGETGNETEDDGFGETGNETEDDGFGETGNETEDDEDGEVASQQTQEGTVVRATTEGKCRISFYEDGEFDDERRWGPLRGDDTCDLAEEEFEVEIHPRVTEGGEMEDEAGFGEEEEDDFGETGNETEDETGTDFGETGNETEDDEDGFGETGNETEDDGLGDEGNETTQLQEEPRGEDITETFEEGDETALAILAPHGGDIQPYTADQSSQLSDRFSSAYHWALEGTGQNNAFYRWYVPSAEMSEASYPGLAQLAEESYDWAVSFSGVHDDTIYVGGGADESVRQAVVDAIDEALPHDGSPVELGSDQYAAQSSETLVNRVSSDSGIWVGQPIADRRNSWDVIAEAVGDVLEEEGGL